MRFSETVKLTAPELIISRRHDEWLRSNDHPVYSPRAVAFALDQLTKLDRIRAGTISASSLGTCGRQQQFSYLGMPKMWESQTSASKMANGSMVHLRWQMAGLTEGWLAEAEVPVFSGELGLTGTMDGIAYEGSVVEIKSINARGFSSICAFGPKHEHLFQMASYLLATERDKGSFIYENKDTQEYREIVVHRDDLPMREVELTASDQWGHIGQELLFEPLNDCLDKKGWRYDYCPYRDRCLKIHTWDEVPR